MTKPKIGIIGYGYLGQAFDVAFKDKCSIYINDTKFPPDHVKFFSKECIVLNDMDMILIGVPTPYSKTKGFNATIIRGVLFELNIYAKKHNKRPLVCIKSAVLPTCIDEFIRVYTNLEITVSPEYLSGRDNIRDMVNHEVLIVGGAPEARQKVIDLFINHSIANKNVKLGECSAVDAALIKYMENTFLALKCVFMSEYYEHHKRIKSSDSVDFNEILKLWMLDSRMGDYPYKIPYFGELGFCSHCLCKDIQAIQKEGYFPLLEGTQMLNDDYRTKTKHGHNRCESTPGGVVN